MLVLVKLLEKHLVNGKHSTLLVIVNDLFVQPDIIDDSYFSTFQLSNNLQCFQTFSSKLLYLEYQRSSITTQPHVLILFFHRTVLISAKLYFVLNVRDILGHNRKCEGKYRKGECNTFCVDSEKVKFKVEIE